MSEQPIHGNGGSEQPTLGGRYTIQMDKPLPHLDSPLAKAYAATDMRAASRSMFGLVCRPDLLARIDVIPQLSHMRRIPLLVPVDAGTPPISDTDGRPFIVFFDMPVGERVLASSDSKITPLREDQIVHYIVKPLMPALKEMSNRFVPHRAIRADNIFYTDTSRKAVILGECVSNPAGMSQPVLYEPIEAGMSRPTGRGPGTIGDDLYAFGVTLVVLLAGCNPVADKSDEELIKSKIASGSYSTLVGHLRISLSMMGPLRGLLCDDPNERWTVGDIESWLEGQQISPKQPMLPTRSSRAIRFAGQDYWNRFSLAYAIGQNWKGADEILKNGELEDWVRRSYSDVDAADEIASIGGGENSDLARTVCRMLAVLQRQLPIRFREFSARIEGVTQCFAAEYNNPEMRKTFVDMMKAKLPQIYLQSTPGGRTEQMALMKTFDMINYFIDRPKIGYGLERALYESNRGWPCQSSLIKQEFVCEIEDLLPALDKVARRGASGDPMDRHIAAFCAARLRNLPERVLRMLSVQDDLAMFRLGMLQILAEVQRTAGGRQRFPALTAWVGGLMEPVIGQFHNRSYRAQLVDEIEQAKKNGNLPELQFLVDNLDAQTQDEEGYKKARAEYANVAQAIVWLEEGGLTSPSYVATKGQQAATIFSAMVSGLAIVVLTVIYVI
ncbi:MAG: hypothetical protein ACTSW2_05120 [Alphaproteobacteria bacterium]